MYHFFLRKYYLFIGFLLGIFFGFQQKAAAQYGVPPTSFELKGKIIYSDEKPAQNIQIKAYNIAKSTDKTYESVSDVNGEFYIRERTNNPRDTLFFSTWKFQAFYSDSYNKANERKILLDTLIDLKGIGVKEVNPFTYTTSEPILLKVKTGTKKAAQKQKKQSKAILNDKKKK